MKKLIVSLAVLLSAVSFSFGQEMENIAISNGVKELASSKILGEYVFQFETERTSESVEKAASFYKQYFSVDFNEETQLLKLNMIENTPSSRIIVARFLSYNKVQYIKIDEDLISVSDFMDKYLK